MYWIYYNSIITHVVWLDRNTQFYYLDARLTNSSHDV